MDKDIELNGTYEDVPLGAELSVQRTIDAAAIDGFANAVQSFHPLHMDAEWARNNSRYGDRVAHGLFISGLLSKPMVSFAEKHRINTVLVSTTSKYVRAAVVGDIITTRITLVEKIDARKRLRFEVESTNQRGEVVLAGEAVEQVV